MPTRQPVADIRGGSMLDPSFTPGTEISELKHQLSQREAELQIISSVQLGLAEHLDVQSIYDLVGDKIRDIFQAQVVMISTYDKQTETIEHRYAIERGERIYAPGHHPIRGFRIWVVESRQPVLISTNVAELAAQLGQPTLPGTITPKTWLGVPMIVNDQVTGILSLQDVDKEDAFDESVVRLLQTLAASMSVALENARLWEQENLYRKALEREFVIGREIQAGFLPETIPQPRNWEIAASLKSAREVAGDFYDVFQLSKEQIGLVIADVCDKGLGAALFMTLFRSLLRAASNMDFYVHSARGKRPSAAERLRNAVLTTNNYIAQTHGSTGMFATVFFGILDLRASSLTYINCGHLFPLLINQHGVRQTLELTGPALGVVLNAEYAIRQANLDRGDVLFAYTDGLTDTVNPAGEFFPIGEVIPILTSTGSLASMLDQIQKRVEAHTAGARQFDDITMLALRRAQAPA
jgi:sigma-B regulation protein RsbU (phosphoserine phosphatase)